MIQSLSQTRSASSNSIAKYSDFVMGDTIQSNRSSNSCNSDENYLVWDVFKSSLSSFRSNLLDQYSSTDIEFDSIKNLYRLINESELKQYLEVNPYLYSILINGMRVITEVIGKKISVSLELYTFIEGGNKSIFITVYTNNETDIQDEFEDIITNKILSYSAKPLNGKIVVSVS